MRPDLYAVITSQRTFEAKVAHERAQVREEEARHERRMRALRLPQQALSATRPGSAARARERRLVLDRLSFQALERQHTFADLAEYKRFMALKAAAGDFYGTVLSPPDAVDRVWRTHTEDALSYLAMCELLVPGFFIHRHPRPVVRPTRPGVPETAREARDQRRRQRALCAYKEAWSEHPPPPCWSEHLVAPSAPAKAPEGEPAHRLPPHLASAHRDPPHLKRDEAPREDDLISHLSALRLTRAAPSSYLPYSPNLIVLKLSGNQVFLACSACDPIGVVKAKLEVKEGIPAEEQRLLHRGWLLDKDHRTLAEYGLTPDLRKPPILHLLLRSIAAAGPRGV